MSSDDIDLTDADVASYAAVEGALHMLVLCSRVSPVLRTAVAVVEDEIKRLRAENAEFRAQFKDADEMTAIFAKWDGTDENLPEGWTPS